MKRASERRDWTDEELLTHLLNSKSQKGRWDEISALRSRPSEQLFLKCVVLTKSKISKRRSLGIDILAQLGTTPRPFRKQTIKLFFDLIEKEKNSEVLTSLLYAIGHNNDKLNKLQIAKLCSLSDTKDVSIKEALVSALLRVDNLNAINTLINFCYDKSSHIRNWATFGIGTQIERNNRVIREALWDRVTDRHQETKLEAILGLAKRNDKRVEKVIAQELRDGECGTLLLEAIVETGDKQYLPLLRRNLKSIKKDKEVNSEWLADIKKCIYNLKLG